MTKCNQSVASAGLRMHYHKCNRPVYEGDKCKIHCASSQADRDKKSKIAYEKKKQSDRIVRATWFRQELDKYDPDFLRRIYEAIAAELEKRS